MSEIPVVVPEFLLGIKGLPLPNFFKEFADDERIGFVNFGRAYQFAFYVPDPCWMARLIITQTLRQRVGPKFNKVTSRQSAHDVCGYWRNDPHGTIIHRRRQHIDFHHYDVRLFGEKLCYDQHMGHKISVQEMLKYWQCAYEHNGDR